MKIAILAVGRLRPGPEATLIDDYLRRFSATGGPMALGPAEVIEVEDKRRKGREEEAKLLLAARAEGPLIALDERGRTMTSPDFAKRLAGWRDDGARTLSLAIGGADGHGAAVLAAADLKLSFGQMVWPHMLARVMLAEQLYRAASILAGGPYHRV